MVNDRGGMLVNVNEDSGDKYSPKAEAAAMAKMFHDYLMGLNFESVKIIVEDMRKNGMMPTN